MSLLNWFKKASFESPQLESLVGKVALYLRGRPSDDQIVPKIVARAIGESEIRTFTALRMLEAQGIVNQHFGLYCGRTAIPLKSITACRKFRASCTVSRVTRTTLVRIRTSTSRSTTRSIQQSWRNLLSGVLRKRWSLRSSSTKWNVCVPKRSAKRTQY